MHILVTGHRGYIGSVLVERLLAAGHAVTGVDLNLYPSGGRELTPAIREVETDFRSLDAGDLAGIDAVVHLAALSNDPMGEVDPAVTFAVNSAGTRHLATAARAAGVPRFVFASSCSIYGAQEEVCSEAAPMAPLTAYAASKAEAEAHLHKLCSENFAVTSLRCATLYGGSPHPRLDLALNEFAARAVAHGEIRLKSTGESWRCFVPMASLVDAFEAVLGASRAEVSGKTWNVAPADGNFTVREAADIVARLSGARVTVVDGANPDRRSYRVDGSAIERELQGFRYIRPFADEVAALLHFWRGHSRLEDVLESGTFNRLRALLADHRGLRRLAGAETARLRAGG